MTYDPEKVLLIFAGNIIVGYANGTFVKASRNEDAFSLTVGADGFGVRSRNANRSGKVEFTLLAASPSNDLLQAQALADELTGEGIGSLLIKDANGTSLASAANAWIVKIPDLERAKEEGEITWSIESDLLNIEHGGVVFP